MNNMSFIKEIMRDLPVAAFMLDGQSPYQDYSGYNRAGTLTGTSPAKGPSIVDGVSYSQTFNKSSGTKLESPIFIQGKETNPFSLEAWFLPIDNTSPSEQMVIGHKNSNDGITINGTVISFVTKYLTASECRVTFDMQVLQAVHVVGVHTNEKNSLYVNGVLVDEQSISQLSQLDLFVTTDGFLYTANTSSTQSIAVNGVCLYASALDATTIARHYSKGFCDTAGIDIAPAFGGSNIPVSIINADTFLQQLFNTDDTWQIGQLNGLLSSNDQLVPQFDTTDTSVPGTWLSSFDISSSNVTSIYGVTLDWDGVGAIIQVSLDSTTWETVTRNTLVNTIPPGFDPTGKELQISVSFPGGIVDDESYINSLTITGFNTNSSRFAVAGRTLTFNNAVAQRYEPPLQFHQQSGTSIANNGSLVTSSDASSEANPVRTLELWIKPTSSTAPSISMSGTQYKNGVSDSSVLVQGQWTLLHVVSNSDVTSNITISGPAQVQSLVVYPYALTSSQVSNIYNTYVDANIANIVEAGTVLSNENGNIPNIYSYDWSIESSG